MELPSTAERAQRSAKQLPRQAPTRSDEQAQAANLFESENIGMEMELKESIAGSINARYNSEIAKLDVELARHASAIRRKRKVVEDRRARELALLDVEFSAEWNRLINYGARSASTSSTSYMGRKNMRGQVPLGNVEDDSASIDGIDVRAAVMDTFEVLARVGNPVHTIPGFGSIISDESATDHSTFSFDVRHGFTGDPSDDVNIMHYSVWMRKTSDAIKFEVEITWQLKSVPPPEPVDLCSILNTSTNWSG